MTDFLTPDIYIPAGVVIAVGVAVGRVVWRAAQAVATLNENVRHLDQTLNELRNVVDGLPTRQELALWIARLQAANPEMDIPEAGGWRVQ